MDQRSPQNLPHPRQHDDPSQDPLAELAAEIEGLRLLDPADAVEPGVRIAEILSRALDGEES